MRERKAARRLSDEIDRMLGDVRPWDEGSAGHDAWDGRSAATERTLKSASRQPGVRDASPAPSVGPDARRRSHPYGEELEVAWRLSRIVERLPPVPHDLERRVRAIVASPPVRIGWARPGAARLLAACGALAALLSLLLFWSIAPGGQRVWAGMMHSLLGQTRVELTPTLEATDTPVVRERLHDLLAAELLIGRAPALPKVLPPGYGLQEVAAVSYPELPSWISQPFYVELCYGLEGAPPGLKLRQYRLLFRQYGGISGVQVASDVVTDFEQVEVAGVAGTMLTLARSGSVPGDRSPETYTLLWERDGLLLELETDSLSRDKLLQVAHSVR